jgi:HTH-type transcriptional regulator / antitoxin HigA
MTTDFQPDWRVHPGETLAEALDERGITQTYLAWATGYSLKHVNRVIKGHHPINATMAVRLEDVLGAPSAEFWLRYQMAYDLHAAREAESAR